MPPSLSILFCSVLHCFLNFTQNLGHYHPIRSENISPGISLIPGVLFYLMVTVRILEGLLTASPK